MQSFLISLVMYILSYPK